MKILNLTHHSASQNQVDAGVIDLRPEVAAEVRDLLTFIAIPTAEESRDRAEAIAEIAARYDLADTNEGIGEEFTARAMIAGELWLMAPLEKALLARGITPMYAFSDPVTDEITLPDGSIKKLKMFRRVGFWEVEK